MKLNEMLDKVMGTNPQSTEVLENVRLLRVLGVANGMAGTVVGIDALQTGIYSTLSAADIVLKAIATYGLPDDLKELAGTSDGLGAFEDAFKDRLIDL